MRIAQVAPLHEAVPPKLYGGTERVVSWLTEELVALGYEVTLFASGDSETRAELVPVWPQALRLGPAIRDPIAPHMLLMEAVRRRADEFDVIHFHVDIWPFSLFARQHTPFVTTLHNSLDLPALRPVFDAFPHVPVVRDQPGITALSRSLQAPANARCFLCQFERLYPAGSLRAADVEQTLQRRLNCQPRGTPTGIDRNERQLITAA